MLGENLIIERTMKDGMNIFVYNNYAIWVTKFSHLYFFFFFSIRNIFHFSTNLIFLIFFFGFVFIFFFFCMCWYSFYKFIKKILDANLLEDEEINPSILNEIIPQIFFSICNFLSIKLLYIGHLLVYLNLQDDVIFVPVESLIIFFIYFIACICYACLFKYENSMSVFLVGLNGIITLLFFIFKEKYIFLPSLLCSGYYLIYRINSFNRNKFLYHEAEENYMKILLRGCALNFIALFLKNFYLINIQIFSFLLLIAFVMFVYSDLNLQKMEILYEPMENRILYNYISSFQLNNKTPGTLN
ncbi:conserved Plasmodium membrane protein, unknown function [Plasmodium gallinaceum]|uniref:Uncharacterized protein n=1 Tax=Plasmodium gallinaceum TaxID=5849 RepID=A0A1J1H4D2_PLAGA|nr:conserved Plasmodium membrane protein, unknown function [Plasmodium gallinaceum]CRG98202.1 conserved Plasmodium membrane protein, unknown function [Plasmodium gallinaceum]